MPLTTASYDVGIIGAGAAGMMCAIEAGRRGRRVILLERSPKIGRKILVSGGGRCNFTNLATSPGHYVSTNADFCTSALSRYTPEDFVRLVEAHSIAYHEKAPGQLFCDQTSQEIVTMLVAECRAAGAEIHLGCQVRAVTRPKRFRLETDQGVVETDSLVIATGGLSLPKIGATDFGYQIARQFGLRIVPTAPALDGFVFDAAEHQAFGHLAGVSSPVALTCGGVSFREAILFTHVGLSGPAALQGSLYWQPGESVTINFLPELTAQALDDLWANARRRSGQALPATLLADRLPRRLADAMCRHAGADITQLARVTLSGLERLSRTLQHWTFTPARTVGYERAEVTRGGVETAELSSKTMEARTVPGLYFIGEVVDVTGQLGGYNFQWAWASGWAAGQVV